MEKIIQKNFLIIISIAIVVLGTAFWNQNHETNFNCSLTNSQSSPENIPLTENGSGSIDQNQPNTTGVPMLKLEIKSELYVGKINDIKDYLNKNGEVNKVTKDNCNASIEAMASSKDLKKISKGLLKKGESLQNTLTNSGIDNSLDNLGTSIKQNEDLLKETKKNLNNARDEEKRNLSQRQSSLETIIKQQKAQQGQIKDSTDEIGITVELVRGLEDSASFTDAVKSKTSNLFSSLIATLLVSVAICLIYLGLKFLNRYKKIFDEKSNS